MAGLRLDRPLGHQGRGRASARRRGDRLLRLGEGRTEPARGLRPPAGAANRALLRAARRRVLLRDGRALAGKAIRSEVGRGPRDSGGALHARLPDHAPARVRRGGAVDPDRGRRVDRGLEHHRVPAVRFEPRALSREPAIGRLVGAAPPRAAPQLRGRGGVRVKPEISVVNIAEKLRRFEEKWKPKIVGEVNDSYVKLVKLQGEFVWHRHDSEDELFLVVQGSLRMRLRDRDLVVNPGEFVIIPRGVEHLPVADVETHVLLFEPKSTLNTGNVTNERTVPQLERI